MVPVLAIVAGTLLGLLASRRKAAAAAVAPNGQPAVIGPPPLHVVVDRRKRIAAIGAVGVGAGLASLATPMATLIGASFAISALRATMLLSTALHRRRRPLLPARAVAGPKVTVIVPAHDEEPSIASCIRSVAAAADGLAGIQILVVDDGSSDRTVAEAASVATDYPFVQIISFATNRGKVASLNRALELATGAIVVTVDADTTLHPAALAAIVRPLADDPAVVAVAGQVVVANRGRLVTDWQSIEYLATYHSDRLWQDALGCILTVPGAFGAWRTSVLRAHGGFSAATLAEDTDLTLTLGLAGGRMVYAPEALAYTIAPETWTALFRQRRRWLRGNVQSGLDHLPEWPGAPGGYALLGLPDFAWKHTLGPALIPVTVAGLLSTGTLTGVLLGLFSLDLLPVAMLWNWRDDGWWGFVQLPLQRIGFLAVTSAAFLDVAAHALLGRPTRWAGLPPDREAAPIDASYVVWPEDKRDLPAVTPEAVRDPEFAVNA